MKKSIEISHLVVNGCSFTYCQGLNNPKEEGWPALLAKKLGVPVVNLAAKGSGNDGILRRTYEYFYLNQKYNNNPFFLLAWSFATRREEFFVEYKNLPLNDFQTISLKGDTPLEREIVINLSTDKGMLACERKKMLHWAACIELFNSHNVGYAMTDFMPNSDTSLYAMLKEQFENQYNRVYNDIYKMKNFQLISKQYEKYNLPCGHSGIESMPAYADCAYEFINDHYDIKVVRAKNGFVDLEMYATDTQFMYDMNEWRNK